MICGLSWAKWGFSLPAFHHLYAAELHVLSLPLLGRYALAISELDMQASNDKDGRLPLEGVIWVCKYVGIATIVQAATVIGKINDYSV